MFPYIIAEIGINHEGKIQRALKLIKNAKKAGANAVKFQLFEPITLGTNSKKKREKKLFKMWKKLALKEKEVLKLKKLAEKNKIDFFCSIFDKKSFEIINRLKIKNIKIASSDITDVILLKQIAKTNKKIFLSTGMANEKEIKIALQILKNNKVILMHCVSLYPCPQKFANLNRIITLKKKFNKKIGYSDHCLGINSVITSINMGATVIEKHFTDDKSRKHFDHRLSADYEDLKKIVEYSKIYNVLKGSGNIEPTKEEKGMRKFARKSIYYNHNLKKGKILNDADIKIKRPFANLEPIELKKIINKKLKKDVFQYSAVKISDLT